ncbi:MAG: histidine--tRNA ligase [Candidatus Acidiferrales bacterium]|jgi:histidyl-tRNA synthetase
MNERKQFRAIKGTRDITPPDSALWNWFERTARDTFESFNFREIRLPIFEETSLFARSVGGETDIVSKEMYTFEDKPIGLEPPKIIGDTGDFIAKVKLAAKSGQIPTDDANVSYIEEVDALWRWFEGGGSGGTFTNDLEPAHKIWAMSGMAHDIRVGPDVSLRPEATASTMRAYIEHGMHALPGNVKLYYIGPMFRRERPQKGRYRQFYQIGAEVLGQSDAPAIDAELIEMLMLFFQRVGLTRTTLYINSIGDKNCRPAYVELLRAELQKVKEQLGADSQRRIDTNPLRVLDSKVPHEQEIIAKLPRIADHLCDACRENYAGLKKELALRGITFEENWRLVRGLDYYTRTTFEVIAEGLGSQNAVCGGGRYDGLVELLGGPSTKGIGFAIGSDRSILSIQESGNLPQLPGLDIFVAWMGLDTYPTAVKISRTLRDAGFDVELPGEELKFKKSLNLADKLGARYALIIGSDEVASGAFTLKRLADADQKKLNETDLLETLRAEKRGPRA